MTLARAGRAARLGIHLPELKSKSVEYASDAVQTCPDGDFVCLGHCGFRNRDILGNMITGEQAMLPQAPTWASMAWALTAVLPFWMTTHAWFYLARWASITGQ